MDDLLRFIPAMIMGKELEEAFLSLPDYCRSICSMSTGERLTALNSLSDIYIPSQMSYEIYGKIYLATMRALRKKNSNELVKQGNQNYQRVHGMNYSGVLGGSDAFSVIGPSGIGKSTTIYKAIQLFKGMETIIGEEPYNQVIPCILVQCPYDNSVRSLMLAILKEIDLAIGTDSFNRATRTRASIDILITYVSQQLMLHVGLLIMDECQNIFRINKKGESAGGSKLVAALTQMINSSGISICLVGLPQTMEMLGSEMQLARRNIGLYYKEMPYGDSFIRFCREVYQYQYVSERTEINEGIIRWLYEHSAGIISVVLSIIMEAQQIAILQGIERLDIAALRMAYDGRMQAVQNFIRPQRIKANTGKSKGKLAQDDLGAVNGTEKKGLIANVPDYIQSVVNEARDEGLDIISFFREKGLPVYEVTV